MAAANKTVQVFKTVRELQRWRAGLVNATNSVAKDVVVKDVSVGFVPTMGALHFGHETLLRRAKSENDIVVLSIYVNPTQFNDKKDFEKYPVTWEQDLAVAQRAGVDAIFFPEYTEMYPDQYKYKITENDFSRQICGAHRPGHFDGVLSVVMKLFQIVNPYRAYFGEKDYQQLRLIQGMVQAFFLPIQIIPVETVREADGLAMSSRNTRLTAEQRQLAPKIYQVIKSAKDIAAAKSELEKSGFKVDYLEDHGDRRFVAAFLGDVRLIDNVKI